MYREVFCKHDMEYTLAIHIVLESLESADTGGLHQEKG